MASFSRSSFIPKSITLNPECRNDPVVLELKGINNNMRKIDAYVVLGLKGKKKQ
jgi:DNA polymerase IIIc chi subunit